MGFHLGHLEQAHEHVELVAPRQPGEVGDGLRNESHSFVRTAIPGEIVGWRTLILVRGLGRPPAPCLGQKTTSKINT